VEEARHDRESALFARGRPLVKNRRAGLSTLRRIAAYGIIARASGCRLKYKKRGFWIEPAPRSIKEECVMGSWAEEVAIAFLSDRPSALLPFRIRRG
jgi:hypothetical protein